METDKKQPARGQPKAELLLRLLWPLTFHERFEKQWVSLLIERTELLKRRHAMLLAWNERWSDGEDDRKHPLPIVHAIASPAFVETRAAVRHRTPRPIVQIKREVQHTSAQLIERERLIYRETATLQATSKRKQAPETGETKSREYSDVPTPEQPRAVATKTGLQASRSSTKIVHSQIGHAGQVIVQGTYESKTAPTPKKTSPYKGVRTASVIGSDDKTDPPVVAPTTKKKVQTHLPQGDSGSLQPASSESSSPKLLQGPPTQATSAVDPQVVIQRETVWKPRVPARAPHVLDTQETAPRLSSERLRMISPQVQGFTPGISDTPSRHSHPDLGATTAPKKKSARPKVQGRLIPQKMNAHTSQQLVAYSEEIQDPSRKNLERPERAEHPTVAPKTVARMPINQVPRVGSQPPSRQQARGLTDELPHIGDGSTEAHGGQHPNSRRPPRGLADHTDSPYTPTQQQTIRGQAVSSPSTTQPGEPKAPLPELDMDKLVSTVRKRLVRELKWDREGRKGLR